MMILGKWEFQMKVRKNEGYIFSDGTLNLNHLLAKAFDFIQLNKFKGKEELLKEIWGLYTYYNDIDDSFCDLYRYVFTSWAELKEDEQSMETASYIWNEDIYNFFNEISPKGYSFGSSEGDGACIGWFKVTND